MHTYDVITNSGFVIHMCLRNGITYILVEDMYTNFFDMKFFTNIEPALEFIRSI